MTSAVLGVSLLGVSGAAFGQSDEQRAGARTLATEGALAFNEGRWKDAVDLFARAESLVHAPPHLLFMARAHAKLGQFVKAREAYLKIVKEQLSPNAPQAFRDAQVTAEEERKQVEPHIGRLLVKVEGAEGAKDLAVTVDGQPFPTVMLGVPQPMDPGEHTVAATAAGFKGSPSKVTLKDAGSASVVVKLEVDPTVAAPGPSAAEPSGGGAVVSTAPSGAPPSDTGPVKGTNGLRIGSYVGFGVGTVGLALGTVFVLQSSSKRKDADALAEEIGCDGDSCSGTSQQRAQLDGLDSDARSAQTLGIVGYAVGGAGVAAGVVLFILSNKKDDAPKSAFIAPYVGPGAAGVYGSFAF
ncbi:MAG TPA: hypothetical protein VJN18_22540 [Polyangiaceae bacterium]|nr:hypothetical protein [Polyangiaceae bacterium]